MKADEKLIEEMKEFDEAFSDGVYVIPHNPNEPRVKVRPLFDYCQKKGVEPSELSSEEMKQFLQY